jgi:uncharacterized low-complexity protein
MFGRHFGLFTEGDREMTSKKKAMSVAVGSVFVAGMAMTPMAGAAENPFALQNLDRGYMVADMHGKCGAGKCGAGKCGVGKCGAAMMDENKDGKVSKEEFTKHHEAMFASMDKNSNGTLETDEMSPGAAKSSDGKCGQGKCGGMKSGTGKCGAGKCGGMKK